MYELHNHVKQYNNNIQYLHFLHIQYLHICTHFISYCTPYCGEFQKGNYYLPLKDIITHLIPLKYVITYVLNYVKQLIMCVFKRKATRPVNFIPGKMKTIY